MNDRELLPCPRCKSNKTSLSESIKTELYGTFVKFTPGCDDCGLAGPSFCKRGDALGWWNTRATDPLMEEMVQALENIAGFARANNWPAYTTGRQILLKDAEQALQKYREMKDAK